MASKEAANIVFARLSEIDPADIIELMNHPQVRRHLPLAKGEFGPAECEKFLAAKERIWTEHGYGPWAFVVDGTFAGWGGLQPEGDDVDLGLVLHPSYWGIGKPLDREIVARAFGELRVRSLTILLPPSRTRVAGTLQLAFRSDGEVEPGGERFMRYRLTAPD